MILLATTPEKKRMASTTSNTFVVFWHFFSVLVRNLAIWSSDSCEPRRCLFEFAQA